MPTKRKPKWTQEFDDGKYRVEVYSTRSEYEVVVNGDINDPKASVWCFPRLGEPSAWAHQAYLNAKAEDKAKGEE